MGCFDRGHHIVRRVILVVLALAVSSNALAQRHPFICFRGDDGRICAPGPNYDARFIGGDGLTVSVDPTLLSLTFDVDNVPPTTCSASQIQEWDAPTTSWVCADAFILIEEDNVAKGRVVTLDLRSTFDITCDAGDDCVVTWDETELAADQIPLTKLDGTGCTDAQVVGGTAGGSGLECQADVDTDTTCDTGDQACTFDDDTFILPDGSAPTTDGQIEFDSTLERIQVGDDGVATLDFYPGAHTTDTGPSPDCAGTSTYQDGEGGCDSVGGDLSGGLDAASVVNTKCSGTNEYLDGTGTCDTITSTDDDLSDNSIGDLSDVQAGPFTDGDILVYDGVTDNRWEHPAMSGDATITSAGVIEVTEADALEANGANCSAGNYPLGVDASGAAEGCTADDDVPEAGDYSNLTGGDGVANSPTGTLAVDLVTAGSDADSATAQSDSGLEFVGNKLTLLRGCTDNQILKWDETDDDWNCEADVDTDTDTTCDTGDQACTFDDDTIILLDGAAPTTDGEIEFDSTVERIQVGDDGVATLEFYPGAHTTDTGPSPDCSGTTTYQDGEGGCDTLDGLEDFETATDDGLPVGNGTTFDTKVVPDCDDGSGHLNYDTTTNAFSCGTTDDDVPEAADYSNLTCGAGLECPSVGTIQTKSNETGFLRDAPAGSCGAGTSGQMWTTDAGGPLRFCDDSVTPALRIVPYGDSSGNATGLACSGCVDETEIATGFSQGSVVFIGASGEPVEDSSNLTWDDAADELTVMDNATTATPIILRNAISSVTHYNCLSMESRDSAANWEEFAATCARVTNRTDTTEESILDFKVRSGGGATDTYAQVTTTFLRHSGGLQLGSLAAASASCVSIDSDRPYADKDCDGTKDAGEEYLDQTGGGGGYDTIEEDGSALTQRTTLNVTGDGATCSDNGGTSETDCAIPKYDMIHLPFYSSRAIDSVGSSNQCVQQTNLGSGIDIGIETWVDIDEWDTVIILAEANKKASDSGTFTLGIAYDCPDASPFPATGTLVSVTITGTSCDNYTNSASINHAAINGDCRLWCEAGSTVGTDDPAIRVCNALLKHDT